MVAVMRVNQQPMNFFTRRTKSDDESGDWRQ
jgi:hypothetical protein